jgi:hypothetical protein
MSTDQVPKQAVYQKLEESAPARFTAPVRRPVYETVNWRLASPAVEWTLNRYRPCLTLR